MKILYWGLFLTACSSNSEKNTSNLSDSGTQLEDSAEVSPSDNEIELNLRQAFRVPERSWDLALHPDGRIFCTAQNGSKVYSWNPSTEEREEERANFADIQSMVIASSEEIFYTTSNYGVTGTLSLMEGSNSTVLASQTDSGILFRWPMDLIQAPDSGWLIADYEDSSVFWIQADSSVQRQVELNARPEALLFHSDSLYIGTEEGLFVQDWPNGDLQKIASDPVHGLVVVQNQIWASSNQFLFSLDGSKAFTPEIGRSGSLLYVDGTLYIGDKIGEWIWATDSL